jgi:hypothetical protein
VGDAYNSAEKDQNFMSHLAVGLISVGLGLWGMASWWSVFGLVMRGVIPFGLLMFGIIAILAACRRISLVAPETVGSYPQGLDPDDIGSDAASVADDILA